MCAVPRWFFSNVAVCIDFPDSARAAFINFFQRFKLCVRSCYWYVQYFRKIRSRKHWNKAIKPIIFKLSLLGGGTAPDSVKIVVFIGFICFIQGVVLLTRAFLFFQRFMLCVCDVY